MLSKNLKELSQNLIELSELKIKVLNKSLPNKEQTLKELDSAMNMEKPKHLTESQFEIWLDTGKKIRENLLKSYDL